MRVPEEDRELFWQWLRSALERQVLHRLEPLFWEGLSAQSGPRVLLGKIRAVVSYRARVAVLLKTALDEGQVAELCAELRRFTEVALFSHRSLDLDRILLGFFRKQLRGFFLQHRDSDAEDALPTALGDEEHENDEEEEPLPLDEVRVCVDELHSMSKDCVLRICCEQMKRTIEGSCARVFSERFLRRLLGWCDRSLLKWASSIFPWGGGDNAQEELQRYRRQLHLVAYEKFFELRNAELFDIIIDMPDSEPALRDLRDCLVETRADPRLVATLRTAFSSRLLHCGVNTSDILTQYISTIKAFRILDPSGSSLDKVSEPIKAYLVTRPDTARQIISSLTDSSSMLYRELLSSSSAASQGGAAAGDEQPGVEAAAGGGGFDKVSLQELIEDDGGEEHGMLHKNWRPEPPPGAGPGQMKNASGRVVDIIHTLVSIYGSKELFVKEYKRLLADRLLSSQSFDTEQDDQTLELLKARFGEGPLADCVIMLRDMYDSKLINKHLQASMIGPELTAIIISGLYWPKIKPAEFNHSPQVAKLLQSYEKAYETHKNLRKLEWIPQMGTVQVQLSFDDGRSLDLSVSPLQATVIAPFGEAPSLSLSRLSEIVGLSESNLRKLVFFWTQVGVLTETERDVFEVVEHQTEVTTALSSSASSSSSSTSHFSSEPTPSREPDELTEDDLLVVAFVRNMLQSTGAQPLETIYTRLSMFLPDFDETPILKLKQMLQKLVAADQLDLGTDGRYSTK